MTALEIAGAILILPLAVFCAGSAPFYLIRDWASQDLKGRAYLVWWNLLIIFLVTLFVVKVAE